MSKWINTLDFRKTHYTHYLEFTLSWKPGEQCSWWCVMKMSHYSLGKLFEAETKLLLLLFPAPPQKINRTKQPFWFLKYIYMYFLWDFKERFFLCYLQRFRTYALETCSLPGKMKTVFPITKYNIYKYLHFKMYRKKMYRIGNTIYIV